MQYFKIDTHQNTRSIRCLSTNGKNALSTQRKQNYLCGDMVGLKRLIEANRVVAFATKNEGNAEHITHQ